MKLANDQVAPLPSAARGRGLLLACVALLALLAMGIWARGTRSHAAPAAKARAATGARELRFNASTQRMKIVEAITTTNRKLDKLIALLESGQVRVSVVELKPAKAKGDVQKKPKK